ncbi:MULTISPECIES: HrpT family type III secretion system protein [unclassified Pseudomonas]|uniref:HrpT family type III secretion system protein n=1 Tax=unclassified Pseudomonas TaxID=196821 RepID=UPI0025E48080|nr:MULTISPECIES: HrpT family type III secretion system protein [unclassified Pseudomonas]
MNARVYVILLVLFATLGGCASRSGCAGYAYKRPDSNDRELVIWWPQDMRQGLDERDHELDFTVVPLKD